MQRAIIAPAELSGSALAELKEWLGITTTREDGTLVRLLRASLATCEAFIRQVPLATTFEEVLAARTGWHALGLQPVGAITRIEALAPDGARSAIDGGQVMFDITSEGEGRFRLLLPTGAARFAVRYSAGIAADWESLPQALAQGIIRLAAHHFRARDLAGERAVPPAAVAALWQPWRKVRLA